MSPHKRHHTCDEISGIISGMGFIAEAGDRSSEGQAAVTYELSK